MPKEPLEALRLEVEVEIRNLERIVGQVARYVATAPGEPGEIEVQGVAKYLHDFYTGVERIFERVAVRLDGDLPAGRNWHTLLQRMGQPFGPVRPAVISRPLEVQLAEYWRFRHLFRHTYGYDLEWKRVRELSQDLPGLLDALKEQWAAFLAQLETQ